MIFLQNGKSSDTDSSEAKINVQNMTVLLNIILFLLKFGFIFVIGNAMQLSRSTVASFQNNVVPMANHNLQYLGQLLF